MVVGDERGREKLLHRMIVGEGNFQSGGVGEGTH